MFLIGGGVTRQNKARQDKTHVGRSQLRKKAFSSVLTKCCETRTKPKTMWLEINSFEMFDRKSD